MKHCPRTTLATATARAQRLEQSADEVLQNLVGTCLNAAFIAARLVALRGVHRRQVPRLQELLSHLK